MLRYVFSALLVLTLAPPSIVRADAFDDYTNKVLQQVPQAKGAMRVQKLTLDLLVDHSAVLPETSGAFLAVQTNEGRWSKLLVQPARQRVSDKESLPILLIERLVTYREGEDRAVLVKAENIRLFEDFVLNLDLGQIVPAAVGGDIRFVVKDGQAYAEPMGKAEIFLITKPLPGAKPAKTDKVVVRDPFMPRYFNGVYKLHDDGRRSGELHLKVLQNKNIVGHFYSDKDGRKYDVDGRIADPNHSIEFRIVFPRTVQTFRGWMFTGTGEAITGYARMEQRQTGFYAVRAENKVKK